jgi:hypothetical protein
MTATVKMKDQSDNAAVPSRTTVRISTASMLTGKSFTGAIVNESLGLTKRSSEPLAVVLRKLRVER